MRYPAIVEREGRRSVATFPDCPGCQTQAEPGQDIEAHAREALEGWLEAHLADKRREREAPAKPSPRVRVPRGGKLLWVDVSPDLSVKLQIRWARRDLGWSQSELAERAGVSQQMIAKLESPDHRARLDTLDKVVRALGARLRITLEKAA